MSDHPGDEADGPQTGEVTCPACGGSGQAKGQPCRECEGTGMVRRIVGDA